MPVAELNGTEQEQEREVLDAEVIDADPTDLRSVFFRKRRLSESERLEIEEDLFQLVKDWYESSSDLLTMCAHWNDLAEGIAPPKTFPWQGSSNLHVPLTETKLNEAHSAARQTLLKSDQLFYVRSMGLPVTLDTTYKLEKFLNFKVNVELPLVNDFSQLIWAAFRDGTSLAQVSWVDDKRPVMEVKTYKTTQEFVAAHPWPDTALSRNQYDKVLQKLQQAKPVRLVEEMVKSVYKGPKVDVIEIQDFVMSPATSINTENARLVGKVFNARGPEIIARAEPEGWSDEQVNKVIESNETGRHQNNSVELKDQIEGIGRRIGEGHTEFVIFNGIYRKDLDGDGIEERYLVHYHPFSRTLLGDLIHYPYVHGRDCFVPIRPKTRPNRFFGRGFCQMLDDIQQELNTQHNQRIDSRTISTVPTFKCLQSAKGTFDPSRPDQRFSPGRVFYVNSMTDVEQFKVNETDFSQSINEEQNGLQFADKLTGASQLRSGGETKMDPRAPAAKIAILRSASDVRMDDYFEELAGNGEKNEGLNAIGYQIMALFAQFNEGENQSFPDLQNGIPQMQPRDDGSQELKTIAITQDDLDAHTKVRIQLSKTSSSQNPDMLVNKLMQAYSLLSNDPLVGGRPGGRLALDRMLLEAMRVNDIEKLLPPNEQVAQQVMMIQQQLLQQMMAGKAQKGRAGEARTRGPQGKKPATPNPPPVGSA